MSFLKLCLNEAKFQLDQAEGSLLDTNIHVFDTKLLMYTIATSLTSIANSLYIIAHTQLDTQFTPPQPTTSEGPRRGSSEVKRVEVE